MSSPDTENADVERTLSWLIQRMGQTEWDRRRKGVEEYLRVALKGKETEAEITGLNAITVPHDQIAWYMYVADTSLRNMTSLEINQASRILPVFARLGSGLAELEKIARFEVKADELLKKTNETPDSALFEMLVALLWRRNGFDVEFIPEEKGKKKTPDIRASKSGEEWFVETKRFASVSDYTRAEQVKWGRMWVPLKALLLAKRLPLVLDITFHVALHTLNDSFMSDRLQGRLEYGQTAPKFISDDTWTVNVRPVDYRAMRHHFEKNFVKRYARQVRELLSGKPERSKRFDMVARMKTARKGPGYVLNEYIDSIDFAACVTWSCDADAAVDTKARAFKTKIVEANSQFPDGGRGAIHLGIECGDGELVEEVRFLKIRELLGGFDPKGKDLRQVYCHMYESYSPLNNLWDFDETISYFSTFPNEADRPLREPAATVSPPESYRTKGGLHWHLEVP